jgi:hypothetical protein
MRTCTTATSLFSKLKTRIEAREARVGVIGLGYVGLPLALLYTEAKFRVTGFDFGLRLRLDRAARILGSGYPQCDEKHSGRQHCALLEGSLPERPSGVAYNPGMCDGTRVKQVVRLSH